MVYNNKLVISETERRRISNLHETSVSLDYVISDWLSPDEKYVIFLDELYDIENKIKLGDVWENFDNFKFFLKHSFEVSKTVPQQIKEEVLSTLDSFVITESTQNLKHLKPILKQFLNEDWGLLGDLGNWAKETAVSAYTGFTDFVSTSYEGIKKVISGISKGEWSQVLGLLKKGALYVARKIRGFLYHPVGLIIDAILVATGIGKGIAWLPWAVAVGLDIYEFVTGDYEDPELHWGWRLLFFGCDIIGLVIAGAAAKIPRTLILGLISRFGKTQNGLKLAVKNSPQLSGFLKKVGESLSSVKGLMSKALSYFKVKSPMLYKFFSGIMGGLGKLITKLTDLINFLVGGTIKAAKVVGKGFSAPGRAVKRLGGGPGAAAATNILVPAAVIGTGIENYKRKQTEKGVEMEKKVQKGLESGPESEYNTEEL
jgi:hypothetical protein